MGKMEFSKKLIVFLGIACGVCIALTILLPVLGLTAEGLYIITPTLLTVFASGEGFYFWKNKNANRAKYAMQFVKAIAKDYGIEAAIRIAEVVLKE